MQWGMTALARPDVRLFPSWAATVRDFGSETMHGSGVWHGDGGAVELTEEGCAAFVAMLLPYADPATTLPEDRVHSDYYWITDGSGAEEEVVGFLALRHALTPWLLEEGGHIGYSVRPSRRGQGHARRALSLALRRAFELGLGRVLLTCDEPNVASARTIERNGGIYEDTRNGKRRYWIETAGEPALSG
ncbi:MAG TPA: GNAT family N-acetyltransferase [Nocardioides sp.]|uniref:GNAT family N-acetyltransferase n=1 Tax=Nocardioides sp. TaxID=35761 RepID=UPI002E315184|nr:GNAT family N-acetyltransferase [Nocardioides sp.]HEX5088079.1 GNAT family N-acetyltransferase [Nocardioides sp.]